MIFWLTTLLFHSSQNYNKTHCGSCEVQGQGPKICMKRFVTKYQTKLKVLEWRGDLRGSAITWYIL